MDYAVLIAKIIIFISIINVWFIRFNKSTPWRGGEAKSMKEEFETYGLTTNMMYFIGGLKVLAATLLIVSIWVYYLALPAAVTMAVLMLGAISMHVKVGDSPKRSLPAFIFLILSLVIITEALGYF